MNAVPSPATSGLPLRLLHLEDNSDDAELIRMALEQDGLRCRVVLVQSRKQFEAALSRETFDLVLSDFSLPDYDGLMALQHVREQHPELPFILVSGVLGEERAVDSLKSGATDYVLKARLQRLPAAVRRALSDAEFHRQYREAEERLQQGQDLFRQITENVEDLVAVLDLNGRRVFASPSYHRLFGAAALAAGTDSFQEIHPDDVERVRRIFAETAASGIGQRAEYRFVLPDGRIRHIESQGSVIRDREGRITNVLVVSRDVTQRKETETRLTEAQKELVELSRRAGMAEVATGVLHNVGNVLNSVNVASHCLADGLRRSKSGRLTRVVALLRQHEGNLADFLVHSRQGAQLPGYLAELASHLEAEQTAALAELAQLQKNIEHIKTIVSMQQKFAQVSGLAEPVQVTELLEDALLLNAGSLEKHAIRIVKEFAAVPPVTIPKHKVLQILVNLIRNAQHACDDANRDDKQMTLRVMNQAGRVCISVSDNGVGIPPENLTRVFAHGFTTKKHGHGFGLHSGALAAKELGGVLRASSPGRGQGATFTLELPCVSATA